jgi:concentrative nucleoside transporter, CNT family
MLQAQSAFGLVVLVGLAWLIGGAKWKGAAKTVTIGIGLQFALAVLLLHVTPVRAAFAWVARAVEALASATETGTSLVFGYLGGGPLPFEATDAGAAYILGFRALPIILLVSALTSLLTYWRILPWIIHGISRVLERSFGIGGAIGLATAANIFVGMIEAPLFVKPYLERVTRSEMFVLMVGGTATIAGTMFVIYATILGPHIPDAAGHLLVASVMSAPAAIMVALLMVPESESQTTGRFIPPVEASGAMDAVVKGTENGVRILVGVIALLLVIVALVDLADLLLGLAPDVAGAPLTLERILGFLLAPLAWLLGLPWDEASTGGALLGTKVILTEFVSYLDLAALPDGALSERSMLIMTYALCGFSSLAALGILIGGLAAMVPSRRNEIVVLGPRSILAGLIATCLTGCVVGVLT